MTKFGGNKQEKKPNCVELMSVKNAWAIIITVKRTTFVGKWKWIL